MAERRAGVRTGPSRHPAVAVVLVLLLGAAALSVATARPAHAGTAPLTAPIGPIVTNPQGATQSGTIVDDPTHDHVLVSDGTDAVRAFDYSGALVGTVSGLGAVRDMAVDGSTLYLANTTAAAIERVDTDRLVRMTDLATEVVNPRTPVVAGTRLWVATGLCGGLHGALTSIDLRTGAVSTFPPAGHGYCPMLASSPTDPTTLLVSDYGLSGATVTRVDVSTGTPVTVASTSAIDGLANLGQIAVDPGGRYWYTASGSPYGITRWKTSDMSSLGVAYPTNPYPTAVAVTGADGGLLAAGMNGVYDPDVVVFDLGGVLTRRFSSDFGSTSDVIRPGGLAFAADGSRLFTTSAGGLRVFLDPGVSGTVHDASSRPAVGERVDAVDQSGAVIATTTSDAWGHYAIGRDGFVANQTYRLRATDPLTGEQTWFDASGAPVAVGSAATYAFDPNEGQPADLTLAGAGPPSTLVPLVPARLLDTRAGSSTVDGAQAGGGAVGGGSTVSVDVVGRGGVPLSGVGAVVLNVTVTEPSAGSFVTVFPHGESRPWASNVNVVAGATVANTVVAKVGAGGMVDVYNAFGSAQVVVDVEGWFPAAP